MCYLKPKVWSIITGTLTLLLTLTYVIFQSWWLYGVEQAENKNHYSVGLYGSLDWSFRADASFPRYVFVTLSGHFLRDILGTSSVVSTAAVSALILVTIGLVGTIIYSSCPEKKSLDGGTKKSAVPLILLTIYILHSVLTFICVGIEIDIAINANAIIHRYVNFEENISGPYPGAALFAAVVAGFLSIGAGVTLQKTQPQNIKRK